ncbi:MAG: glycosyltransferase family 9 protein [Methylococcales bacterium]|nr:glycosyltransferase family 9 protein [Methylococcales bacterium]
MPVRQPANIQPKRILVITLRYLGDTLLLTPLLSSLKHAYPAAEIDVLLPRANLGMLEGNRDVSALIPMTAKGDILSFGKLLCSLFRRYDLAISTQAGDRPVLCAILGGRFSMGFVDEKAGKFSWKRWLLGRSLEFGAGHGHAVLENLRFCQLLNIAPRYTLTPPRCGLACASALMPSEKYAVLHIMPQWRYKQWHEAGWVRLAYCLQKKGCAIVLTGSGNPDEQEAIRKLQRRMPPATRNLAGRLSLAQLTELIGGAELFIGPDTGITHLAAATGIPTLALFGPTDPQKWAPWPRGYAHEHTPFQVNGLKKIKNVYLLQSQMESGCVPCQLEGCERNRLSHSACLDQLSAETVMVALAELFANDVAV